MPYLSLYPGLRCPVYLRPYLDMCSASAGRPKKSLLSNFPLLLMGVVGCIMVANSMGLIDRIFLGDGNIWVSASCYALPYINSVQSECMMSGYVLLTLYLRGIFRMYHRFVDRSCTFGKSVYLTNVVIYRKHNVWDVLPFFIDLLRFLGKLVILLM